MDLIDAGNLFSIIRPMPTGGHQDDDGGKGSSPTTDALPIRRMIGEVALEISTTAEGRAAGLSVEIWPDQGVWLRVRSGHELQLSVEPDPELRIRWRRVDPQRGGLRSSEGELGPARLMRATELHKFITRWLSWRARG